MDDSLVYRIGAALNNAAQSLNNSGLPYVQQAFMAASIDISNALHQHYFGQAQHFVSGVHPEQIRMNHLMKLLGYPEIDCSLKYPKLQFEFTDQDIRRITQDIFDERTIEYDEQFGLWRFLVKAKFYRYTNRDYGSIDVDVKLVTYMGTAMSVPVSTSYWINRFLIDHGFVPSPVETIHDRIAAIYCDHPDQSLDYAIHTFRRVRDGWVV